MSHFGSEPAEARSTGHRLAVVGRAAAVIAALVLAAGCTRQPARHEANARVAAVNGVAGSCPADRAPLPAPDCEFKAAQSSVDPGEFTRLKLAYERQCYQRAEKAARERLRELQADQGCRGKPPSATR